jgi:hypothetical protein
MCGIIHSLKSAYAGSFILEFAARREKYFLGLSAMLTKILVWTKYVLKGASDVQLRCRSFPLL